IYRYINKIIIFIDIFKRLNIYGSLRYFCLGLKIQESDNNKRPLRCRSDLFIEPIPVILSEPA
ncbi:MAG: hypothetical protein AB7V36_10955, partial [Bacteroidales bacterium]